MSSIEIPFAQPEKQAAGRGGVGYFLMRLVAAAFLSGAAVVVGALGWGVLAYLTNSVFVLAAIVIGFMVAFAVTFPFQRISIPLAFLLFFPTAVLTALTVILGDYVYYTLSAMREFDWGLADAAVQVARNFIDLTGRDTVVSLLLAAFGTLVGFFNAVRRD